MKRTLCETEVSTLTCRHCGSLYERTTVKIPWRDRDAADCQVCGRDLPALERPLHPPVPPRQTGGGHSDVSGSALHCPDALGESAITTGIAKDWQSTPNHFRPV